MGFGCSHAGAPVPKDLPARTRMPEAFFPPTASPIREAVLNYRIIDKILSN